MSHPDDKYARVYCFTCQEKQYLTRFDYNHQMNRPDSTWRCPKCGDYDCSFDDSYWEEGLDDQ